jgi:hypothetical protein
MLPLSSVLDFDLPTNGGKTLMGQAIPGEARQYSYGVSFYISPAGHWRIDLTVTENWGKPITLPLFSGTADEYLSVGKKDELTAVVSSHAERGVDHIISPF